MAEVVATQPICDRCKQVIPPSKYYFTTGWAEDSEGHKFCYACCATIDREFMHEHGRIALYLTDKGQKVRNWPGTLEFPAASFTGGHNIAGTQTYVYFWFEGHPWIGRKVGENTEICHCRRLKHPTDTHYYLLKREGKP